MPKRAAYAPQHSACCKLASENNVERVMTPSKASQVNRLIIAK
eukprot:CAMPEP_0180651864 /NCGR_PEP_ID=MMETSP1037_2-20121125/53150_1 /TAXON_ID=632150 /ORGANISM="Azadinium spinosum, Strain 3D9" /LENGTH=42 /DNA_ID= /DNA_START= /DNA_END= /DNA_ORIENTATION=